MGMDIGYTTTGRLLSKNNFKQWGQGFPAQESGIRSQESEVRIRVLYGWQLKLLQDRYLEKVVHRFLVAFLIVSNDPQVPFTECVFCCRFVRLCALINQTFETKTHSERIFWIFDNLTKKQKMNINWIIFSNQTQANLQNASQFAKRKPNRNVQKAWANTAPIKYSINNLYWWHFLDKIWQTVIFSYFQKWLLKFF